MNPRFHHYYIKVINTNIDYYNQFLEQIKTYSKLEHKFTVIFLRKLRKIQI